MTGVVARAERVCELLTAHGGSAFSGSEGGGGGGGKGETHMRSALVAVMNTPESLIQLRRLSFARGKCDDITLFETAITGNPPPELMTKIEAEIESTKKAAPPQPVRLAELHTFTKRYVPLGPVHQIAYGGVKSIVGHPELAVVREVAIHRLSEVMGRAVARCYSSDGNKVPEQMAYMKLDALAASVSGGANGIGNIDLTNDADLPALAKFLSGSATNFRRTPDDEVYCCPVQVMRLEHVAVAVLDLMGIPPSAQYGRKRIHSGVSYLAQTTGFAQTDRVPRLSELQLSTVCPACRAGGDVVRFWTALCATILNDWILPCVKCYKKGRYLKKPQGSPVSTAHPSSLARS